jgi:hypothetical protein
MSKGAPGCSLPPKGVLPMIFCDQRCPYASFSDPELSGACRTFEAVYCRKLKIVTHKNMPCRDKKPASKSRASRQK